MNRRRLFILIVFVALAGAIGAVLWTASLVEEPSVDDTRGHAALVPHQNKPASAQPRDESRPIPSERPLAPTSGHLLRFVALDSATSAAIEATIGMAGMWPPAEAQAPAGGLIPLPITEVTTLWGDDTKSYEVLARTPNRAHGFWGDVSIEDLSEPGIQDVLLRRASPLEVVVSDESGAPISGAEVRVSRGFIGLVHLTKKTDESGVAVFEGLPDGDLQVTVQAQGFARRMRSLSFPGADERVALSLQEGSTKIGNGELERLAKQVVVSGNRTVVSTGDDDLADGEGDQEDSRRPRHPLDLYVVDRSGSPVHGALIQLWKDGRKLFEKKSSGATPVGVELATPFSGTLVAFDGQRGEGRLTVELTERAASHEFIVRLDRDLLTLDLPPGRINSRGRIEQILGVELVRDNDAWLADVRSPASAAARAGIERGDRVVFLREVSGGYSALIERSSQRMRIQVTSED